MQTIRSLFLCFTCFLAVNNSLQAQTTTAEVHHDTTIDENLIRPVVEAVSQAVVRIKSNSEYASSGVIVSEEGHVVFGGSGHRWPDLSVVLPSGESVPATNLGWSGEWMVGVLKLAGDRKWPHVEFGSTRQLTEGESCFEVGFHANEDEEGGFTRLPVVRFGVLSHRSPSGWFATDLEPRQFEYGAGTFNMEGKLLGISVAGVSTEHHLSTAAEVFTSHWQHFVDAKNLDWVRYPPSKDSLYRMLAKPDQLERTGYQLRAKFPEWKAEQEQNAIDEKDFLNARKTASATTVRIIQKSNRDNCWSGVIVSPEGHITTCAHTHQVDGEELVVVLPDDREVPAVALGTNWVSDIGLVKLTEEGPWNYAELGDSSLIGPDDVVLCAGFPVPHVKPLPPVSTVALRLQKTPYVGWNDYLMLALSQKLTGGSSGGGVFDRDGRLVAIYLGPGGVRRIEVFQAEEEYLNGGKPVIVDAVAE